METVAELDRADAEYAYGGHPSFFVNLRTSVVHLKLFVESSCERSRLTVTLPQLLGSPSNSKLHDRVSAHQNVPHFVSSTTITFLTASASPERCSLSRRRM